MMHLAQRLFATIYDPVMAPLEHGRVGAQRATLLADAYGHVLDVGAGTGANLEHLPAAVTRITAIEPDAAMRAHLHRHLAGLAARRRIHLEAADASAAPEATHQAAGRVPGTEVAGATDRDTRPLADVEVVDAVAEALPLADASVDVALTTLVLCTVRDPEVAVAELRRVLRPDGLLLVLEHVVSHQPRRHRLQRALTPAWKVVARGCHLDRDTRSILAAGGFDVTDVVPWQLSDHSRLTAAITGVGRPA
jgi:ubiquinone/menaquinone biosynthesis C-methylase UbiE